MSVRLKLAAFVVALGAAFAAGLGIGDATAPDESPARPRPPSQGVGHGSHP